MRTVIVPVPVAAVASTAGAAVRVEELEDCTVTVHGGPGFSLLIQVLATQDTGGADVNTDWLPLTGTAITAPGVYPLAVSGVAIATTYVRMFTTTVGTAPKVLLSGHSEGSS